jgi:hypothetical protein
VLTAPRHAKYSLSIAIRFPGFAAIAVSCCAPQAALNRVRARNSTCEYATFAMDMALAALVASISAGLAALAVGAG